MYYSTIVVKTQETKTLEACQIKYYIIIIDKALTENYTK